MKMVKKILFGALAVATVLTFASCGPKEDEEGALKGEKVDFVHEDANYDYYRSFKATSTKHYSANAEITIETADDYASGLSFASSGSPIVAKGGFGFLFGLQQTNKDAGITKIIDGKEKEVKFYDFGIVCVRWNAAADKAQWYVSWVKNSPNSVNNYNNFSGFEDTELRGTAGLPVFDEAEVVVAWQDVPGLSLDENGNFYALIRTIANEDGSYNIELYDAADNKLKETTVTSVETGLTEKKQLKLGRYITVYKGQSVKGKIDYKDTNGNVIPADYDEE